MGVLDWIDRELDPRPCDSTAFMYDDMASQSGRSLAIIYREFDPGDRSHWRDRGSTFDFLLSTRAEGKRILDFGPGDGWPSLNLASHVAEVVGVDGSQRRVEVCTENAERMGIRNARFVRAPAGDPLPFEDRSFDAVVAASSVEQSPDPEQTIREFHRVLKPGGHLRIDYEHLDNYRDGQEQEAHLGRMGEERSRLTLYDRHPDEEYALMYALFFSLPKREVGAALFADEEGPVMAQLSREGLEALRPSIDEVRRCQLTHPSGRTFARWMEAAGFSAVLGSHSGSDAAGRLLDNLPAEDRPGDLAGVDRWVRPVTAMAVELAAPIDTSPMLTATK